MHRPLILGLLFSLLSFAANAACPGSPSTCGDPMQAATSGSVMYATAYGVTADGATSDDVALKAAADACAAKGTKLILPPGQIKLTGAATVHLQHCLLAGAGPMGGLQGDVDSQGTMFLITSTTVKPFTIGDNWGMTGVNFYWPNQLTGLTPYPPLFSPPGDATHETDTTQHWYLDHVVMVNPYDGIVTGGGGFSVTNSLIYPMRDAFRTGNIGDSFRVSGIHFTPGPWFAMTGYSAPYANVKSTNVMFHAVAGGVQVPGATNFAAHDIGMFAMGTAIKIDNGATIGISDVNFVLDGVGTVIDASSGGTWAGQSNTPLRGGAGCAATCFKMGANSTLFLDGWFGSAQQSFVETSGSNIMLHNVFVGGIGAKADATDYYLVHMTANTGGTTIAIKDSNLVGKSSAATVHGVKTDVAASRLSIQNTTFQYLNDTLDVQAAGSTVITGNLSLGIVAQDIVTATLGYATGIVYRSNQWEKPPKAVATACGTGCSVAGGALSGLIAVGSTNPTTSGTLTLPFSPYGVGGGLCRFYINGSATPVAASTAGSGVWNFSSGATDMHGAALFFNCPGQE